MPWYEPVRRSPTPRFQFSAGGGYGNDNNGGGEENEWIDEEDFHRNNRSDDRGGDPNDTGANEYVNEDEEEFNVQNYLNERWDYGRDARADHRGGNDIRHDNEDNDENYFSCPLNFDGFQHRVESQLGNIFPGAEFALSPSSNSRYYNERSSRNSACNDTMHRQSQSNLHDFTGGVNGMSEDYNQHHDANNSSDSGGRMRGTRTNNNDRVISKTAQFFHPRPVMALQPYKGFFSPMTLSTCTQDDEKKISVYGKENEDVGEVKYNNAKNEGNHYSQQHYPNSRDQNANAHSVQKYSHQHEQNWLQHSSHQHFSQQFNSQQNFAHKHYHSQQSLQLSQYQQPHLPKNPPVLDIHDDVMHEHDGSIDRLPNSQQNPTATNSDSSGKSYNITNDKNDDDMVSHHRPRKLFDMPQPNIPKRLFDANLLKQAPVQSKLKRDPKTGKLSSSKYDLNQFMATAASGSSKAKNKSWDDYGGRVAGKEAKDGENKKKTKSKNKEKDCKGKKEIENKRKGDTQKAATAKEGASGSIDVLLNGIAARHKQKSKPTAKPSEGGSNDVTDNSVPSKKKGKRKSSSAEDNDGTKSEKTSKSKKQRQSDPSSFSELGIKLTADLGGKDDILARHDNSTDPKIAITEQDFEGIEEMGMQNAGMCMQGLNRFIAHVTRQTHVAWTMLFLDPYTGNYTFGEGDGGGGKAAAKSRNKYRLDTIDMRYECTTPFLPSTKKYCTEKGPICTAWNCTCDNQIRSLRGKAILLGAMFVFRDRADAYVDLTYQDDELMCEQDDTEEMFCYLLPLGPTAGSSGEPEFSRMSNWPVLPFECEVSLRDRWNALKKLLHSKGSTKFVTYNAQVQLLPFYYHKFHDKASVNFAGSIQIQSQTQTDSLFMSTSPCQSSGSTAENDGTQSQSVSSMTIPNDILYSIWDLRVVSWMLRADASDAELEFRTFKEGFAHLVPRNDLLMPNVPALSRGLIEAQNDLEFLYVLYPIMNNQMEERKLLPALHYIEAPVQSILSAMECRGIGFYPHRLQRIETKLNSRIEQLETESRSITKDPKFLLSSPQQVSHYLFDVMKLEVPQGLVSKTNAGSCHRSTSEEALRAIKVGVSARTGTSPTIIDIILEFRALNKLLTTYIRGLPKFCWREKRLGTSKKLPSRIFPHWMQTVARTGRLSCRKPNLQQVPNSGAFGSNPREAFVPSAKVNENELALFACDYSQKEVRILAHMSEDKALLSLFQIDNVDIYKQMSSLIRNKPLEEVTSEDRAIFKQVTLAILYGMSPNQVAKKLSVSKTTAQQMMNDFFRRFFGVKAWMDRTKEFARKNQFVLTISGRRRYLDGINSDDDAVRGQAERQAINTVIQGSSADIMKVAMINMTKNLMEWEEDDYNKTSIRPRILLQIHDELLLELMLNTKDIKRLQKIAVKSCCEDCENYFRLRVPLLVKCSCGLSWGNMKEI